ncbi:LysR family transcriptional regulator, partial [Burkholderia territorii]|nr:LysR family transcriptional regulator [Burkholderia territorii]
IDEYVYYLKARRQSPAIDAFLACILPVPTATHERAHAARPANAR